MRFMISRPFPGATPEDLNAAAYRAIACTFVYTGMEWIKSYWDPSSEYLTCIYEAESEQQVFDHARRARVPCETVLPVEEISPEEYMDAPESSSSRASG